MPHVLDSKLFILWQHKASQRILVVVIVIAVLSLSRRGYTVCVLPLWSGWMFYYLRTLHPAMTCNVVRFQCHIADLMRCGTMWRDVARCRVMWDSEEFLLGFCYDCSSKKVYRKFHRNLCWIVAGLYFYVFCYIYPFPGLILWPDAFLPAGT